MTYQNNAFTEMMNGSSIKKVSPNLKRAVVVIEGDRLEAEVTDSIGAENGGQTGGGGVIGGGERK